MKLLLAFTCAFTLVAQTPHLGTTDDGSVLYFATTLRIPGGGQSMASKLFRIDSTGAHLIGDEGNVAAGAPYWNLSSPSVSGDGSRLVYTAHQFCNVSDICVFVEFSTPMTPPGAANLFLPADQGGVAISRNGRFAVLYSTSGSNIAGASPVLIDFASGSRTILPQKAFGTPAQVSSTGMVLAVESPIFGNVTALMAPDGTVTVLSDVRGASMSDDGSILAYSDPTGRLMTRGIAGRATPIGPAGQYSSQPLLNRDGTRVIFLSSTRDLGPAQVFYARTDGSGLRPLTNIQGGVSEAILSGDGKVAYALTNAGVLLKIDTATANATQLIAPFPVPHFSGGGSPGSLVIGTNFNVPLPTAVGSPPYSTSLSGVTVTVEDQPAPLLSVSPTEIVFQIPWEAPASPLPNLSGSPYAPRAEPAGPAVVLPGAGPLFEAAFPVSVYTAYPTILALAPSDALHQYSVVAIHQDGVTLVTEEQPASLGETVTMYGTGFGPVSRPQADGVPSPGNPLSVATQPTQFSVRRGSGFGPITPSFLGLAPGLVGVYQLNFQIPADVPVTAQDHFLDILGGQIPLAVPAN